MAIPLAEELIKKEKKDVDTMLILGNSLLNTGKAVQAEEVRRLEDELAEHTVVAPFSGYVTAEHTEVGQWVAAGSPVVDVVEVDRVEVEVPVLESCVSQLELGAQVRVEIGALPGRLWTGRIAAIVPQADVRSRSFPVKVRLENRTTSGEVLLMPGMFARVVLPVGRKSKACLVPKDAVVLGGRSPVVYAAVPTPKAEPPATAAARLVPVELGASVDELIEVRGLLKPGERVVVEGNEGLSPGRLLIVVKGVRGEGSGARGQGPVP